MTAKELQHANTIEAQNERLGIKKEEPKTLHVPKWRRIVPPITDEKIAGAIQANVLTDWDQSNCKFKQYELAKVKDEYMRHLHNSTALKGEIGIVVAVSAPDDGSNLIRGARDSWGLPKGRTPRRDFTRYYIWFPKYEIVQGFHSHLLEKVNDQALEDEWIDKYFLPSFFFKHRKWKGWRRHMVKQGIPEVAIDV